MNWQKHSAILSWGGLLAIILMVVIVRLNFLDFPFERDEGLYAFFASIIMDGGKPYEAFYDPKPPGLFYSYALIMTLFDATPKGLHLGFLLINIATIVFIFEIAKSIFDKSAALTSAFSFATLSISPHAGGLSVLSEHLVVFWATLGLWMLILFSKRKLKSFFILSALAFGFTLFVKQNGIFFIASALVYLVYYYKKEVEETWLNVLKDFFGYGLITLVPSAILSVYLVSNDLHRDFFYWMLKYPTYLHDVSIAEGIKFFKSIMINLLEGYWEWWLLAGLGLISLMLLSLQRKWKVLIFLFTCFSFLSITPRLTFHGHYFLFIFPSLAILIASSFFGVKGMLERIVQPKYSNILLVSLFLVLAIIHLITEREIYFQPNQDELVKEIYGINPFVEAKVISEKISELAKSEDQLAVYGGEMQVYFYSGLKASTKHLYGPYLVDGTPEQNQRQEKYMQDLEEAQPRFFVAIHHPLTWVIKGRAKDQKVFHWYTKFTQSNYRLIGLVDMFADKSSEYTWGDNLETKNLKGKHQIFVWERKM